MTETPNARRPPPRPPKSQYLLNREAELLAKNNHSSRVPTSYPKGINPFGESSDDESEVEFQPQQPSAPPLSTPQVDKTPFSDSGSDHEKEDEKQTQLKEDEAPRADTFNIVPQNMVVNMAPPPNPFDGFETGEEVEVEHVEKMEEKELETAPHPATPNVLNTTVSLNPFDDADDEEKKPTELDPKKESPPPPPKVLTTPPRRRQAPQPPVLHASSPGLSQSPGGTPSTSGVSPGLSRKHSISCESIRRKPPAPPLPVGQKREIRAEGFVKYPKLRREIEEVNARLSNCDEDIEALRAKMEAAKGDPSKTKKYTRKLAKLTEKRQELATRHRQLSNRLQEQVLEDRHADLEFELRNILAKQEHLRSAEERNRADELLKLLVEIVEERDKLVAEQTSPQREPIPDILSFQRPVKCCCCCSVSPKAKSAYSRSCQKKPRRPESEVVPREIRHLPIYFPF